MDTVAAVAIRDQHATGRSLILLPFLRHCPQFNRSPRSPWLVPHTPMAMLRVRRGMATIIPIRRAPCITTSGHLPR